MRDSRTRALFWKCEVQLWWQLYWGKIVAFLLLCFLRLKSLSLSKRRIGLRLGSKIENYVADAGVSWINWKGLSEGLGTCEEKLRKRLLFIFFTKICEMILFNSSPIESIFHWYEHTPSFHLIVVAYCIFFLLHQAMVDKIRYCRNIKRHFEWTNKYSMVCDMQ